MACWGGGFSGENGVLGHGEHSYPVPIPGLTAVSSVATGEFFTCAVKSAGVKGTVKCWGSLPSDGTPIDSAVPLPVLVAGRTSRLIGVTSVSAGFLYACAVTNPGVNGRAHCWGFNGSGQLGDGTKTAKSKAVTVSTGPGVPLSGVTTVSVGHLSACATLVTGAVRCWGKNTHGQLGRGTLVSSVYAVPVVGIDGVAARARSVSVGTAHACAALVNGSVRCWGWNSAGQLGDGTIVQRPSPVVVKVSASTWLAGVTTVSAGDQHTCAIIGTGAGCAGALLGPGQQGTARQRPAEGEPSSTPCRRRVR